MMLSMFDSMLSSAILPNAPQLIVDLTLKSVCVLLAAWAVAAGLRQASAATRHWVWSLAIAGLLALPILSVVLPGWRLELLPSPVQVMLDDNATSSGATAVLPNTVAEFSLPVSTAAGSVAPFTQISASPSVQDSRLHGFEIEPAAPVPARSSWSMSIATFIWSINWELAALAFWGLGFLLIVARLLAGTFRMRSLAKQASQVTENAWVLLTSNLATRLRLRTRVELLKSKQVSLPMTWGALRSVVMLPAEADNWPQECRSIVLLHELAHIKRRDCLTQNLAQLACALYWFNPLVWLAARQLRVERELACDDQVLEVGTKASDYASHLVEIAKIYSLGSDSADLSPVTVGMACSQLESRVRSILDPSVRRRGLNRLSAGLIGIGAACLVLSLAAVKPWAETAASSPGNFAIAQVIEIGTELQSRSSQAEPNFHSQAAFAAKESDKAVAEETQKRQADEEAEQDEAETGTQSPAQGSAQTQQQSSQLTVDQLIEMKTFGVTPEFIESIRKAGFDNLSVRELSQLRIHGVSEDFIRQARTWGGNQVTLKEIIQLKISGVTPEYISAMKRAGYENLPLNQISGMSLHGVTPEYAESLRRAGYDKLTADQLMSLKIHGVDEAYAKEIQNWMGGKPSVNELLQFRIHGVTPEYSRAMKSLGYDNIPINKLIQMKIHGVSEQYVKEMRDLGFDKLTVDQLVQMKIHGVTADYVKKMRAAGLKNVSVNQMIEMKIHGIDSILLKERR